MGWISVGLNVLSTERNSPACKLLNAPSNNDQMWKVEISFLCVADWQQLDLGLEFLPSLREFCSRSAKTRKLLAALVESGEFSGFLSA